MENMFQTTNQNIYELYSNYRCIYHKRIEVLVRNVEGAPPLGSWVMTWV